MKSGEAIFIIEIASLMLAMTIYIVTTHMGYQRRDQKIRPVARNCPFCHQKSEPDYKEINVLSRYLSERGKLLPQTRTGLCSFHQRKVTQEVKRARQVAMLPFVVRA